VDAPTRPPRRFAWIAEKPHRRSSLRAVLRAVRDGWAIDAGGRAGLVATLAVLLESPDLSAREAIAVARIVLAMEAADAPPLLSPDPGARP
jgi:hypothetical protein